MQRFQTCFAAAAGAAACAKRKPQRSTVTDSCFVVRLDSKGRRNSNDVRRLRDKVRQQANAMEVWLFKSREENISHNATEFDICLLTSYFSLSLLLSPVSFLASPSSRAVSQMLGRLSARLMVVLLYLGIWTLFCIELTSN